jgi:hypothetical protein
MICRVEIASDMSAFRALEIDDTMVPTIPVSGERDTTGQTLSRLRIQMRLQSLFLKINTRELWIKGRDRDMKRLEHSRSWPFAAYVTVFPKAVDDLQLSEHR